MKKKNLLLLILTGFTINNYKDTKSDYIHNSVQERNILKKEDSELIGLEDSKLIGLEDYEYYDDYELKYTSNSENNNMVFFINDIKSFNILRDEYNNFSIEAKFGFIKKKINFTNKDEFFYIYYKFNFFEKIILKISIKEILIKFTISNEEDTFTIDLIDIAKNNDLSIFLKDYNNNIYNYLLRKNYKLKFIKLNSK